MNHITRINVYTAFLVQFGIIVGSQNVPYLLVPTGEDASFEWILSPKPDISEIVIINKNRQRNVYAISSKDTTVFRRYSNRLEIIEDVERATIKFRLKETTRSDAGLYFANYNDDYYRGQELIILDKPKVPTLKERDQPIENQEFILNCSTWSTSGDTFNTLKMKYNWTVDGGPVTDLSKYMLINSRMSVKSISSSDQDKAIRCSAYEHVSAVSELSEAFVIDVKWGPKTVDLVPPHTKYRLSVDGRLPTIYCVASCKPMCDILWKKLDRGDENIIERGLSFSISKISLSNSGKYACLARNSISELQSDNIDILVSDKPAKPVVVEVSPPVRGADLRLECTRNRGNALTIYNITNYIWQTNRQSGEQRSRYTKLGNTFRLRKVKIEDNGTSVSCKTETGNGEISESSDEYKVVILYGPDELKLLPSDTTYRTKIGHALPDIYCGTDCNPKCSIRWYKNKETKMFFKNNILSLGILTRDKSGNYHCEAENAYGKYISPAISVDVYDIRLNKHFSCEQNAKLNMECSVKSSLNRPIFLHWIHTRNNITIRTISGRVNHNRSRLLINGCHFQDAGEYTCRLAKTHTSHGDLSVKTSLTIYGLPGVINQQTSLNASLGYLTIHFYSVPNPTSTQWFRNSKNLQNYARFHYSLKKSSTKIVVFDKVIRIDCYEAKLTILNFTNDDTGDYTFEIANEIGKINYTLAFSMAAPFPLWLIVSSSIGGVVLVIIIVAVFSHLYRRRKVRNRNKKTLEVIRQRLAKIETVQRLQEISDESFEDHYASVDGEEIDLHEVRAQEWLQNRNHSFIEQSENEETVSLSEISTFSGGDVSSSYEDLKIVIQPSPYVNATNENEIFIVIDPSDVESNLADDEISSSSSEISN